MERDQKSLLRFNKPVNGVWSLGSVQAIFMAGQETGIPVNVKDEEGQEYPLHDGQQYPVPNGYAYIEIGTGRERDLSKFWRRVKRIKNGNS